jgi:osmotically-inducible protein OsmY
LEEIQRLVERRLREKGFKSLRVAVSPDRIVTLSGALLDQSQRDEAIRLARLVPDVREVRPLITVAPPLPPPGAIQQQVELRLRENGLSLKVEVNPSRIVTLAGVLESEQQSEQAKNIAASVPGVTQVKDMIIIAPPAGGPTKIR